MRILLDENFPLPFFKRLRSEGLAVEHIIDLGVRGISDAAIIARLREEDLLFLTQDNEFLDLADPMRATIVVSHVDQGRPIAERMEKWSQAVRTILRERRDEKLFELFDNGDLAPWKVYRSEPQR